MISSQLLQFCSRREIEKIILEENALILQKYLSERSLIPEGNLVEISFEELEHAPLNTMETIYRTLGMEGFDAARPRMELYLESVRHYKRNTYRPLPESLMKKIQTRWDFWFKEFGYSK
jgi:hypothetical protein